MYNFRFLYNDDTVVDCKNITSVKKHGADSTYTGDSILTGYYPINTSYYLFSDDATYTVSPTNLKAISILKV